MIDFVTNGEDSSNVDSDEEEEITVLPPIERAEAETDCDSDIWDDENEGQPLAQQLLWKKIWWKRSN